jgi:hypothetical protein
LGLWQIEICTILWRTTAVALYIVDESSGADSWRTDADSDASIQWKNDESSGVDSWRTETVRFKRFLYFDTQSWLHTLCTWMNLNQISEDSAFGRMNRIGVSSSVSTCIWTLWSHTQSCFESCQALILCGSSEYSGSCYFRISVAVRSALLQHFPSMASMMVGNLLWIRGSYFCRLSVDDGVAHPQHFYSAADGRIDYLLWIRDVYCMKHTVVLNVSLAEREC